MRKKVCAKIRRQKTSEARIRGKDSVIKYQLRGFNNNITTTSLHQSSDNSTILKKIFDARIFFKKEQTSRTLLPGQAVRDFMLQVTSYNAVHLGEWAAKIQVFVVT